MKKKKIPIILAGIILLTTLMLPGISVSAQEEKCETQDRDRAIKLAAEKRRDALKACLDKECIEKIIYEFYNPNR
jgi:hypothetical protein